MPLLEMLSHGMGEETIVAREEIFFSHEEIFFSSGDYRLHGCLAYPEMIRPWGSVIIAGPHPLLGGNMNNNVVRSLGDGLAQMGMLTFRFDYRGVGQSQGPAVDVASHLAEFWRTSHAPDEMELYRDLQSAWELVKPMVPDQPIFLIGYSFGCSLLPRIDQIQEAHGQVLIAPTITKHDYRIFQGVSSPLMVVHSEDDFATHGEQVESWMKTLKMPAELVSKRCDNHFFRGHESWLNETVGRFFKSQTTFKS